MEQQKSEHCKTEIIDNYEHRFYYENYFEAIKMVRLNTYSLKAVHILLEQQNSKINLGLHRGKLIKYIYNMIYMTLEIH